MKFDVHAVINWVFFTIIVCPDSLISEMSRIAKCECIQCLLILQHSLEHFVLLSSNGAYLGGKKTSLFPFTHHSFQS